MGKLSNYLGRLFSSSRRFHPIATTMPQQCHNTIMFYLLVLPAVSAAIAAAAAAAVAPQQQMNVLYILSDDMRADLGSYGIHSAHTPNLDALASRSLVLERAYCQIAVCSPSRQSFLTSLRPDTHGVWNFIDANPKTVQATPGHFRDHGYLTLGLGKIFHENQGQWNKERYWNLTGPAGLPYFKYESNMCPHGDQGGGQCIVADEQIYDYSLRIKTMEYLRHAAQYSKQHQVPFFLMAGFRDPHLPWAAPQRMYNLYNESSIDLPPKESKTLGQNTPLIAWSKQMRPSLANGMSFPFWYNVPLSDPVMRNQRRAYYASVSYADEHIGAILKVLEEEGLANSTMIVFHSDHGYALGEHGYWEKKSNFDLTVRVPLIIHVPGVTDQDDYDHKTGELMDLVDVFPTISALAGLPLPQNVDGMDLSFLVTKSHNEARRDVPGGRTAAFHQFPACRTKSFHSIRGDCNNVNATDFDFMGYSIRTNDWRYTAWYYWNGTALSAEWDGDYVDELYYHKGDDSTDFGSWENENLSAKRTDVASGLRSQLESFFRRQDSTSGLSNGTDAAISQSIT